ncbi:MAG TPA: peptidase inhibitor family I36 protein [Candidatus Dormibacteraeota bacterium]|jgi:hypothetical protein
MRGILVRRAVLTVTVTAVAVTAPTPFTARSVSGAISDCPPGEVCVWPGANYSGTVTAVMDDVCHSVAVGSALNGDPDATQELRVYTQPGCTGTPAVVGHGSQSGNLSGGSYLNYHSPVSPP